MAFYPLPTTLNSVYELENLSHTITYVEDTTSSFGALGVGVSTGGQSYPVTIVAEQDHDTIIINDNNISGKFVDAFDNTISYRTIDHQLITVNKWEDVAFAIVNESFADLYYYAADTRTRIIYNYIASANGQSQTYVINVDNDWSNGRRKVIKYTDLDKYRQEILIEWINANSDKVDWIKNILEVIDWENNVI
jgi:hypothetical protein